jgi:GT2 family glycosyltransferase/FMN phosphatase YigB (HAD superfamily)
LARVLVTQPVPRVYSFDIFDTLIARLLSPEYVKFLVAALIRERVLPAGAGPDAAGVYRLRREVEDELKRESQAAGLDPEYRYADSIRVLLARLGVDEAAAEEVGRYELELERACLTVHQPVVELIRRLHGDGHAVVLISDNYLGDSEIRLLLRDTGILDLVRAVYVSSGPRLRKDSGRLFDHVLKDLGLKPGDLLHVGDNPLSDYEVPRARGITSLLLDVPADRVRRADLERLLPVDPPPAPGMERLVPALDVCMRARHAESPPCAVDVAMALAPSLHLFLETLLWRARALGVKAVYFLAREGHLFKQIFDRLSDGEVKSVYLCASRTSTFILSLPALNVDSVESILDTYPSHFIARVRPRHLLDHLKIPMSEAEPVLGDHGVGLDENLDPKNLEDRARLSVALLDPRMGAIYRAARARYLRVFLDYLKQTGMLDEERVLMADVGWSGSMLVFMSDLLREQGVGRPCFGYFFGYDAIWDQSKGATHRRADVFKDAFFYRGTWRDEREARVVSRIPLEMIPSAPHGTIVNYARNTDGTVEPQSRWCDGEQWQYEHRIAPMQAVLLDVVTTLGPLFRALRPVLGAAAMRAYAIDACLELLVHPSRRVARHYVRYALHDTYFGVRRRLPCLSSGWWWEAVQALGLPGLPWRARCWVKVHGEKVAILLAAHARSACVFGPVRMAMLVAGRVLGLTRPPHADVTIATNYRWQRPPSPAGDAPALAHAYYLYDCRSGAAARRALSRLPEGGAACLAILHPRGGGCVGVWRRGADQRWCETALEGGALAALLGQCHDLVVTGHRTLLDGRFRQWVDAGYARTAAADLMYTDSDSILCGQVLRPRLKPDWSPEYFQEWDYVGDTVVLRRDALEDPAGMLASMNKDGVYATLLAHLELWRQVAHIPWVLAHGPYRAGRAPRAVYEALSARRAGSRVARSRAGGYRLVDAVRGTPKVAIIIPFRDKREYLERCVESIRRFTAYPNIELVLVNNQSGEAGTLEYLARLREQPGVRILDFDAPFNYSAINNFAVERTEAPYVLLLNNDTEVRSPEWLDEMLQFAQRPEVGAVGAKLLYGDGCVQHAGVIHDFGEVYPAGHIFHRESGRSHGYEQRLASVQRYAAVTAACLLMRREVYVEVGGFDPGFQVAYNDLDLCCRLRARGYAILWTPYAELVHHENVSRGNPMASRLDEQERERFRATWRGLFAEGDPGFSPRLTLSGGIKLG